MSPRDKNTRDKPGKGTGRDKNTDPEPDPDETVDETTAAGYGEGGYGVGGYGGSTDQTQAAEDDPNE